MPPREQRETIRLTLDQVNAAIESLGTETRFPGVIEPMAPPWFVQEDLTEFEPVSGSGITDNDFTMTKEILKQRHLNREERQIFHRPAPDWVQTQHGEVNRSACSLVVDDLVSKYR